MRILTLGVLCCAGLLMFDAAEAASRRAPRRAPAPAPKVEPAPTRLAYVPVARRTKPPALSVRPEVSEGEWGQGASSAELSSDDLRESSITLVDAESSLEQARMGATVSRVRDRNLRDVPSLVGNLDRPLADPNSKIDIPEGVDLSTLGFTVIQRRP